MICRFCGYENADANRCCSRCGRQLDSAASEKERGWAPQEAKKKTYAQLASEADERRRSDRSRRQEDGKTCAGIAAVIACAAFLLAGVSAGAYAWITHSAAAAGTAEMNYTSGTGSESAADTAAEQQEDTVRVSQQPQEETAETSRQPQEETSQTSQQPQQEQPSESAEAAEENANAAEAAPSPGAAPDAELPDKAGEDASQEPAGEEQQEYAFPYDAPEQEVPETVGPGTDSEAPWWEDPNEAPYEDDQPDPGNEYTEPYGDTREEPETEGEGPSGFMWDMITRFYRIGGEAA